eukprot:c21400_g2_i2 orf=780-4208(-)
MKNLLRRLHLSGSERPDDHPDSAHPKAPKSRFSFPDSLASTASSTAASASGTDSRPFSGISSLISVAKHTLNQAGNFKQKKEGGGSADRGQRELNLEGSTSFDKEQSEHASDITDSMSASHYGDKGEVDSAMDDAKECSMAMNVALPSVDVSSLATECKSLDSTPAEQESLDSTLLSESAISRDPPGIERTETAEIAALQLAGDQAVLLQDEEMQVRVAMAISARDDPEAARIETMKDVSLGSDPLLSNSTAHLLAYRYWKYSTLSYKDTIVDGFYDVYGVVSNTSAAVMPSLTFLQETSVSNQVIWEAVLVNRPADIDLVNLERKAKSLDLSSGSSSAGGWKRSGVINRIAEMVADQMGGPVNDTELLLQNWRSSSAMLRLSLGSVVLPLGCLSVGLQRHRALLFKVLADAVGIPCQLVKGRQHAGGHEAAVNIIKFDDGREFIINLMAVPGSLRPYDGSLITVLESNTIMAGKDRVPSVQSSNKAGKKVAVGEKDNGGKKIYQRAAYSKDSELKWQENVYTELNEVHAIPARPSRSAVLRRSPSWTEGVGLPAARDTKVKDASQYMIYAAKDNPTLAQKLHDVLLESGVQAPPDLFTQISPRQLQAQISEDWKVLDESQKIKAAKGDAVRRKQKNSVGPGRPASAAASQSSSSEEGGKDRLQRLNSVEGLGERRPLDLSCLSVTPSSSPNSSASSGAAFVQSSSPVLQATTALSLVNESLPPELIKHGPVAAAAATAAVVASSMLAAAAKSDLVSDATLDVPVAVAATATAAVVAATSAVVGIRLELPFSEPAKEEVSEKGGREALERRHEEANARLRSSENSVLEGTGNHGTDKYTEDERVSDKSSGSISAKSDRALEDVAEWEIPWEELVIGERIGLGSYGEVYRGDWHGTEVAVKKFLDQDLSGDALLEFGSEVRLMKRMRHPNVVLFMGAVMRAPNLSIVTEFLPRGSLYRLIHRSNNQPDEKRRMRMALDVARGMNYLHTSTPVIVHRDLKSPNLLVDKNWVVKVCDFGLSRIKNNTFLSSKSTAGTPEWMAPEVLRNEPSNEKSDVYSFGVILWELVTLQQPWGGMNPMQVVGAVGFQHRTLDIPENVDPALVRIIRQCWQSDPALRPSFADIMTALRPLQQRPFTQQSQISEG